MRAVQLVGKGKVELRQVPVPEIGDDDILLQVKACGICGSDLHFFNGMTEPVLNRPYTMGHEFTGVIAKMGRNVDPYWKIGDRVVSDNTAHVCGRCPACAQGHFVYCEERGCLGASDDGGFAEYVRIPGDVLKVYPNTLYHIPECLSFEEATLMDPVANGYTAIVEQGEVRPGDNVAIFGAGALGLMALQQAAVAGAAKIVLIGLSSDKRSRFEIGRKYGATHCIASDEEEDLVGKVRGIAGPNGIKTVVDAAGAPIVTHQAIQILRNEGILIRIGMSKRPYNYDLDDFAFKNISIRGHMGYSTMAWKNSLALIEAGKLDLKSIITGTLPLEEYAKGVDLLLKQEAAKIILIP